MWGEASDETFPTAAIEQPDFAMADVFSSERSDGLGHRVVLDLDLDTVLVASSSPGHYHLVIDKALPWPAYSKLLTALAEAGVIEDGYNAASQSRQASMARTPWTKKPGTE